MFNQNIFTYGGILETKSQSWMLPNIQNQIEMICVLFTKLKWIKLCLFTCEKHCFSRQTETKMWIFHSQKPKENTSSASIYIYSIYRMFGAFIFTECKYFHRNWIWKFIQTSLHHQGYCINDEMMCEQSKWENQRTYHKHTKFKTKMYYFYFSFL